MYIYSHKFIHVYFIFRKSEFPYLYLNFNSNCMSSNSYQTEMMLLVSGCQHISFQLFGYFTLMKSSHNNVGGMFILFILRDML